MPKGTKHQLNCGSLSNQMSEKWVFGSPAYSLIPEHSRDKFDAKCDKLLMIGYCMNGYRLWNPATNEIIVSRNVSFNDNYKPIAITPLKSQEYLGDNCEDIFDEEKSEENDIEENNPELEVQNFVRNVQQDESRRGRIRKPP